MQECGLSRTYIVKVKFDPSGHFTVDEATMEINISLRCAPVKGKANRELINIISKHFDIKPSNIKIIHGLFYKTKVIQIF
ncbi:hypothetical protein NARC_90037 [Candidatus Nitrosocosmicus arcticus]|uniref:Uncharacterized protein n=1 Tax=Candidatus Nitrosocosmicus arcticus TaxID=2035267 RepID=A0A557SU50_9ARCH|nr:hypothetical protein NARC_90037 [Candidatus Nitrosocosmicus arcticus]